jgi:hypothetical protein
MEQSLPPAVGGTALRILGDRGTVAVLPFVVPRLAHLVDRDLAGEPAGIGVRDALVRVLR